MGRRGTVLLAIAALVAAQGFCGSAPEGTDWNQWLGPNRDGTTPDSDWNPEALNDLKILWQASVGAGRSAPIIAGKDLYVLGMTSREQAVRCLRADTGKEVWKYVIPRKGAMPGMPTGTGAVDADHFYITSAEGVVICLDRKRGELVWQQSLADLGAEKYRKGELGWPFSPLLAEGLVILPAGEYGMALNKDSGELVWGRPGSDVRSSMVLASVGERTHVVAATSTHVHLIDLETGETVQSHPWKTQVFQGVQWDPLVVDQTLFMSKLIRGHMLSFSDGGLTELWQTQEAASYCSSWVHVDGHLYGNYDRTATSYIKHGPLSQVRCLDAESGDVVWGEDCEINGMLIAAGDKLVCLSEKGILTVVAADPSGYHEYSAAELPEGKYITPPVLVGKRLYIRNFVDLYCIDMR